MQSRFPFEQAAWPPRPFIDACVPDSDRWLCHQCPLCAGRHRLHADLRRLRRPQSLPRRHHGGGCGGGLGRRQRAACEHLCRRADRGGGRAGRSVRDLFRGGAADPEFPAHSQRGEGNLRPHRNPAVGDHDPGIDRLFLHQQCQDRASDRRRRRQYPRRPHAAGTRSSRRWSAASSSGCCGCW